MRSVGRGYVAAAVAATVSIVVVPASACSLDTNAEYLRIHKAKTRALKYDTAEPIAAVNDYLDAAARSSEFAYSDFFIPHDFSGLAFSYVPWTG